MNKFCLCCGEELSDVATAEELKWCWHRKCVKKFFGTAVLPELEVNEVTIRRLVAVNLEEGLTIPGVQKKISLHLSGDTPARLTLMDYPAGYIMKPQADEYARLPEYEWAAMQMARVAGLGVVPFALYDAGGNLVYLTKRIDRGVGVDGGVVRYAMEDFCQLSERLSEDKYKGSYEGCAKIIRLYSRNVGLDLSELFIRVVVSFVIGNSDMHLKNLSLIERAPGARVFELSRAYDILPVNVVEPNDLDELALSLNGKRRRLEMEDFLEFAKYCNLELNTVRKILSQILVRQGDFGAIIEKAPLPANGKERWRELIKERMDRLTWHEI